jgi:glycosyltransferase involved in cell wall biosynthesis
MPRILFVDHSGALGGAELYLRDVLRAYPDSTTVTFEDGPFPRTLVEDGHSVQVLTGTPALRNVQKQSSIFDVLCAIPGGLALIRDLRKLAQSHDVVFLNSQKALFPGALAARLAGRPVLWNLHDILSAEHFSSLNRRIAVWWANWFVDTVIVNSQATRSAFVHNGGSEAKTHLVYNGIDASPFDTISDAEVQRVREATGTEGVPCVGVFSRLAPWKGQHVLLDALADVPGVHALLVGDALFAGDRPYAKSLQSQARRLGIADRVHFLGFRSDIPALMRAVDVVAHTSTAPEPFGRVIVEGLLAGRPVIATRAGGASEILNHEETGYLVPPGDAQILADVLRTLTVPGSPKETTTGQNVQQVVDAGSSMARARFSVDQMHTGIEECIAACMGGSREPVS